MAKRTETELTELMETGLDLADRTLFLTGDIDMAMAAKTLAAVKILGRKKTPVTVVLSSHGGCIDSGWAIYDAIVGARFPTTIIGYGPVMSMAVAVLQAAGTRLLMPYARLLLHPGTAGADLDARAFVSFGKEVEFQSQQYLDLLAMHSTIGPDAVQKLILADTFLSSWEAVKIGLADKVVEP